MLKPAFFLDYQHSCLFIFCDWLIITNHCSSTLIIKTIYICMFAVDLILHAELFVHLCFSGKATQQPSNITLKYNWNWSLNEVLSIYWRAPSRQPKHERMDRVKDRGKADGKTEPEKREREREKGEKIPRERESVTEGTHWGRERHSWHEWWEWKFVGVKPSGFIVCPSEVIFNVCNDCSALLYVF